MTVPEDWRAATLGFAAHIEMGQSPPSADCNEDREGIPFYQGNGDFGPRHPGARKWTAKPLKTAEVGDILVSVRAPVGALNVANERCCIGRGLAAIRSTKADQGFVFYSLHHLQHLLGSVSQGSTFDAINKKDLNDLPVSLPPLPEQKKIAQILGSVDEAVQATQAVIDQTRKVKQGLLQQLLTRGIGHTRFKQTEIGEIPVEWEALTANELLKKGYLKVIQDGNHGSQYPRTHEFGSQGVPFIAASNVMEEGTIDFFGCRRLPESRAAALRIPPAQGGDVILTHNATVGRVAIVPRSVKRLIASTSTTYYRVHEDRISAVYLAHFFRSPLFQRQLRRVMGQTTRNQVPITAQRELVLVVPPLRDQRKIAEDAESLTETLVCETKNLSTLLSCKRGLMQDLLTGRVRVKPPNANVRPN